MPTHPFTSGRRLRLTLTAATVASLAGCSLATSFDGLTGGADGGDACVAGGYYCGGDKVGGETSWLYRCESDGSATLVRTCTRGCKVRPGHDDACICVVGGKYCGDDQVVGDPRSLYSCGSDYSATLVQACSSGCRINVGSDDSCQ